MYNKAMPKHAGGMKMPEDMRRGPANDNEISKVEPRLVVDNTHTHMTHEVEKHEKRLEGPLGDIAREIDAAHEGTVIFMRGITAKHDEAEAHHVGETRTGAKGYVEKLKAHYAQSDEVIVVGEHELREAGVGDRESGAEAAIKKIANAPENAGKKIVVDFSPELDVLFEPWESLGDSLHGVMNKKGASAQHWLEEWMAQGGEEGKEHEGPTVEEVVEMFGKTLEGLKSFKGSRLGNRPYAMGFDADSPMALAFLVFCETGRLDAAALESVVGHASRVEKRIGFVHFHDDSVRTSLGQSNAPTRRLAA